MDLKSIKYLFIFVVFFLSYSVNADIFTTVKLPGITLDIPSHWKVMDKDTRSNITALGDSVAENSDYEKSYTKDNLLVVTSQPKPIEAMIRVSVVTPPDFDQNDLLNATSDDIEIASSEIFKTLKQVEEATGLKIISLEDVSIDKIGNLLALKVTYLREDMETRNDNWRVIQYRVPLKKYYFTITLSYRQSASHLMAPILERVKQTISFQ